MEPVYLLGTAESVGPRRSSRLSSKGATKAHRDCPACLSIGQRGGVKWKDEEEVKYYFASGGTLRANAQSEVEAYKVEGGRRLVRRPKSCN